MIKVDENGTTLHLTRGDATHEDFNRLAFYFPIWDYENEEETRYEFKPTDKITFIVYERNGYTRREVLKKEYLISDLGYTITTTKPELILTKEDTRTFELLNKPKTYWYEILLNDDTTIFGSTDDGAKKIIVYPGGTQEMEGDSNV